MERVLNLPQITQRTDEWYNARKNLLTASEVSSVLNISPFQSAKKLMQKKVNNIDESKLQGNYMLYYGSKNEDIAIDLFKELYNLEVHNVGLLKHEKYHWLGGSPDGVTSDDCLIEVKCPLKKKITHTVHDYYYSQIQVCLEIANIDTCYYIQYKPCSIFENGVFDVKKVQRNQTWFDENIVLFEKFWNNVLESRKNPTLHEETKRTGKCIQNQLCLINSNIC